MNIFKPLIISFSLYSKIPMPKVEWNKENMQYALCFFPLIGLVIGFFLIVWAKISSILGFNSILFAAVASYIPIMVTGGIHMDGFCDTIDGISSNQPIEKKLKILSDPNVGSFALIKTCAYFLLYFAVFTQLDRNLMLLVSSSYIISRILSALAIIKFKSAKKDGLLYEFQSASAKKIVMIVLSILLLIVFVLLLKINSILAIAIVLTAFFTFMYYKHIAYKEFGGITGDLAGYFLQLCEIAICFGIVLVQGVIPV